MSSVYVALTFKVGSVHVLCTMDYDDKVKKQIDSSRDEFERVILCSRSGSGAVKKKAMLEGQENPKRGA